MKIVQDIITAAKKKGIDPYTTPFKPKDLDLKSSDYGSFSDYCENSATQSGQYNKRVCLKVVEWTETNRPKRYILLPSAEQR